MLNKTVVAEIDPSDAGRLVLQAHTLFNCGCLQRALLCVFSLESLPAAYCLIRLYFEKGTRPSV